MNQEKEKNLNELRNQNEVDNFNFIGRKHLHNKNFLRTLKKWIFTK